MAKAIHRCPDCNGNLHFSTVQAVREGELIYYRSSRCGSCDYAVEEDGTGAPQEIREQLVASEGAWAVVLSMSTDRTEALSIARSKFDLSMDDLRRLKEIHADCVGYGTRVEMEWLQSSLSDIGIKSDIIGAPVMSLAELT